LQKGGKKGESISNNYAEKYALANGMCEREGGKKRKKPGMWVAAYLRGKRGGGRKLLSQWGKEGKETLLTFGKGMPLPLHKEGGGGKGHQLSSQKGGEKERGGRRQRSHFCALISQAAICGGGGEEGGVSLFLEEKEREKQVALTNT